MLTLKQALGLIQNRFFRIEANKIDDNASKFEPQVKTKS